MHQRNLNPVERTRSDASASAISAEAANQSPAATEGSSAVPVDDDNSPDVENATNIASSDPSAGNRAELVTDDTDDLEALAVQIVRHVDGLENSLVAVRSAVETSCERGVALGQLLVEAKGRVRAAGQTWLPWLEANCQIHEREAQRYMRLAKNIPKLQAENPTGLSGLSRSKALRLLEKPIERPAVETEEQGESDVPVMDEPSDETDVAEPEVEPVAGEEEEDEEEADDEMTDVESDDVDTEGDTEQNQEATDVSVESVDSATEEIAEEEEANEEEVDLDSLLDELPPEMVAALTANEHADDDANQSVEGIVAAEDSEQDRLSSSDEENPEYSGEDLLGDDGEGLDAFEEFLEEAERHSELARSFADDGPPRDVNRNAHCARIDDVISDYARLRDSMTA